MMMAEEANTTLIRLTGPLPSLLFMGHHVMRRGIRLLLFLMLQPGYYFVQLTVPVPQPQPMGVLVVECQKTRLVGIVLVSVMVVVVALRSLTMMAIVVIRRNHPYPTLPSLSGKWGKNATHFGSPTDRLTAATTSLLLPLCPTLQSAVFP